MTSLGPMVYRSAHAGAALLVAAVLQFVAAMAVAQFLYPYSNYSLQRNDISDLGYPAGSAHGLVFDTSISLLGLLTIVAVVLIRTAFTSRTTTRIGLVALALAGLFAFTVGRFPEHSPELGGHLHSIVAALTFFLSGLSLLFLGLAMVRDTRWRRMRLYTFASGIVTWIALVLYVGGHDVGLGPGGMERVIVAPVLLWSVVAGVHLLRIPRYRPTAPDAWSASPSG